MITNSKNQCKNRFPVIFSQDTVPNKNRFISIFHPINFKYYLPTYLRNQLFWLCLHHSIADSSLFPTSMYLSTVEFLALKKTGFSEIKNCSPPKKFFFTFFLCNFSVRTLQCFQNFFFFCPQKVEKTSLKSCS